MNPKIFRLTPIERDAYVCSLCMAVMTDLDGKFEPLAVLGIVGCMEPDQVTKALEKAGLWEQTPKGWRIHDFLDWNESREEYAERVERLKRAGASGGRQKARNRRAKTSPSTMSSTVPSTMLKHDAVADSSSTMPSTMSSIKREIDRKEREKERKKDGAQNTSFEPLPSPPQTVIDFPQATQDYLASLPQRLGSDPL